MLNTLKSYDKYLKTLINRGHTLRANYIIEIVDILYDILNSLLVLNQRNVINNLYKGNKK